MHAHNMCHCSVRANYSLQVVSVLAEQTSTNYMANCYRTMCMVRSPLHLLDVERTR